jgi:hypothetical protein
LRLKSERPLYFACVRDVSLPGSPSGTTAPLPWQRRDVAERARKAR